ncbi:MAG: bifunctional methylenetetrahydrofolate dehydrogenase/methenyltetrahydrofolate cyclohydrolase FolD [Clostridiales bacterium]|nr:bifunctional methylenetetrahydrofolate dehydrogenase/methenyltetrahydrofolate cyclohydrolase FolD [Clostridiales bacterium]
MDIIDGKAYSAKLRAALKEKVEKSAIKPGLAVVLVGCDPASQIYVRNKIKACEEVGVRSYSYVLPETATQEEVENLLDKLAADEQVNGILLQLPLPKGLDAESAMARIPVEKDVDGFSAENIGLLCLHKEDLVACTPLGVMKLLENEGVDLCGKNAVVLGRSDTVGKPMAMLLLNANATVTVCHSKTKNLKDICKNADILVAAIGRPKFVTADMVKEGAIVIDIGINRDENGKICGDVDFENVKDKVSKITPVPGGVGPMTITMLMYNACKAAFKE